MTQIGERLESLRGNITQRKFAEMLGVPLTSYTNWLAGPSSPKMEYIILICSKLGISADWLLGLTGDNKNLLSAAAESRNNSPEKAVESGVKTSSAGALNAAEKGVDCATCKYRLFAEAFKALQPPA